MRTGIYPAVQESRFYKGLRFRLALSYMLVFGVLLLAVGWPIRSLMRNVLELQQRDVVDEEWSAIRAYAKIENNKLIWDYDKEDPEEKLIIENINDSSVYLVASRDGVVVEKSTLYEGLPLFDKAHIAEALASKEAMYSTVESDKGILHLLRSGSILDEKRRPYFLVAGTPLTVIENAVAAFTRYYYFLVPLGILASALLGWLVAGRALAPLDAVAVAAHRITGANLRVQIPTRGAGDELDGLIDSFNAMTGRLERSFEQIRQFSTDVSHELRTPLTAIRGQLEVALFTAHTPDQYRDAMVNALQDVEQLTSIVRALLLLSQAESGQLALQVEPVDLADLVRDIVDQFQIPAEEQSLELTAKCEMPKLLVSADRTQIGRLITNLLSNAVKYTPSGGSVRVVLKQEKEQARLDVIDTGIGIPADHLPHIFDRFYRVRPATSTPLQGLGLGLSFVAWIVRAHKGSIEVDSIEKQGSTFTVRLPLAAVTPHSAFQPSATGEGPAVVSKPPA